MTDLSARLDQLTPIQRAAYALKETQNRLSRLQQQQRQSIAVVGMSCRFPGSSNDLESFWQLLENKRNAITEVPAERWDVDKYYDPDPHAAGKMVTKWGGFIDNAAYFDNHFFGISDREAIVTDPQQRILLELTWEALEDSGLIPSSLRSQKVGVFVGLSTNEYLSNIIQAASDGSAYASIGNSSAAAANRISYAFDFRGPSLAVDTACSSALFALHQACNSLRTGECDVAVVAAANIMVSPLTTINLTKAGVCSPDGKTRSFDAAANGFVRGDGAGILVLKRSSDAITSNDRIHANIIGTATNHNGSSNSLTAPRRESQEAAMRDACSFAQVSPDVVSYVEAHATGTPIGDSIELAAINNVYAKSHSKDAPLKVGCIKTNVGHTEAASGLASIIKVVLAVKHHSLPATLHFERPHQDSVLAESSIDIPTSSEAWKAASPLVAAVNATGFGGANAHVLIQEYVAAPVEINDVSSDANKEPKLLVLSARTESSLRSYVQSLIPYLANTSSTWEDITWTAALKRDALECRLAAIASSKSQAIEILKEYLAGNTASGLWQGRLGSPTKIEQSTNDTSLESVASRFVKGQAIDWKTLYSNSGNLVDLPHYAWQRKRHWIAAPDKPSLDVPSATIVATNNRTSPSARPELNVAYTAPTDALEQWMADQWSEALNVTPIGVKDNFFELGGDSLQATGLLNRLQKASGESIAVTALFDAQDISSLAIYLRQNHSSGVQKIVLQQSKISETETLSQDNRASQDVPGIIRRRNSTPTKKYVQNLDDTAVEELLRQKLSTPQASRDSHV